MTHWLRQLFRTPSTSRVATPPRARLGLDRLEERDTPATFVVTSIADGGAGSLRDAITQANANGVPDTIFFQAGLGPVTLTTAQLALTETGTTISGPSGGTQVVQRSTAGGTPNFRIFYIGAGATASLNGLTISNGNANVGGGIQNDGPLTVTNSTVSGNTADFGGGIWSNATLTVTNSTVTGNTANSEGGGVRVFGTTTVTNVTITGNRSDNNNSGGEVGGGLSRGGGTVTLNNTLIAGNFRGTGTTRDDVDATVAAGSLNNLIGDGTGLTGITNNLGGNQVGTAAVPIDPLLGTLGTYGTSTPIFPLLAGSPAINAGSNAAAAALTTDGRGAPFVRTSGTVDIGAFEVQSSPVPLVVSSAFDFDDGFYGAGQLSLREAVRLSANPAANIITFADALNGATITLGGTRLEVLGPVSIIGPSRGVTIDGNLQSQVFYFDGRSNGTYAATLRNLTVTRGQTGDPEEVINGFNSGDYGGGILNDRVDLTLENVTVSNNVGAFNAGGLYNWQGANSRLTLRDTLFAGNSAGGAGGAIYNWSNATITAVNTTFSGNTANGSGGAIFQNGGAITLTGVTATLNRADADANASGTGGFLNISSGGVALFNSIVSGNLRGLSTADEITGTLANTSSNNVVFDTGTAGGLSGTSNNNKVGVNPLLGALADNGGRTRTHALLQNSPALGAGSASAPNYSAYDQRGTARDNGSGVQQFPDAGAYEVQHPLAPVGVPTTLPYLYAPKPSATANEAFVKGLYQSTLLRAADSAGLSGWLTQLAGGTSREVVANGFVNSVENRSNQVRFFYRYFLNRDADTTGLNFWVDSLRGGTDEGTVMTGFILSAEFSGNNDNTQFVNLMYYALLSRPADTAGLNGWLAGLTGGLGRDAVVNAFLRSEEGINRVVGSLFQTYLKRPADTLTYETFRAYLNANNTFGRAAILILGSNEFYNNASDNLT